MLDLDKPLGVYQKLSFYGDHEKDDVIYYLPDEVHLDKRSDSELYELSLIKFYESKIVDGSSDALEQGSGSILELGVCCDVDPERLKLAVEGLKKESHISSDVMVTTPPWIEGSTSLITLATSSNDTDNGNSFVDAIVVPTSPSIGSANLKSVYNVRYDRKGTDLIQASLMSESGSVAGIVYDLKYAALSPSINLKMTAYLSRCQETIKHNLDAGLRFTYYAFQLDLAANLEWLTKKMEENGDLVIDCVTQAQNPEEQAEIDKLISEFKDSVLKELFDVSTDLGDIINLNLLPSVGSLTDNKADIVPFKLGVTYKLKDEHIDENRVIEVDYNQRRAIIRQHFPQSNLWTLGNKIIDNLDSYIKSVPMGPLWLSQSVNVRIIDKLESDDNDIQSVEVLVWKAMNGVDADAKDGCFGIPAGVNPIACFTFDKDHLESHRVQWSCEEPSDIGYYYQVRVLYSQATGHVVCPDELMSAPILSYSSELPIITDHLFFYRDIPVTCRALDFDLFPRAEVVFTIIDKNGDNVENKAIILNREQQDERLIVRGRVQDGLKVYVTKLFTCKNGNVIKSLTSRLIDNGVVLFNPLVSKNILLIIEGEITNVENIIFSYSIVSEEYKYNNSETKMLSTSEIIHEIPVSYFKDDDIFEYSVKLLIREGSSLVYKPTLSGKCQISKVMDLPIMASDPLKKTFSFSWSVPVLSKAGLSSVTLRFQNEAGEEIETKKFKDRQDLSDFTLTFECPGSIRMFVDKKDLDLRTIKSKTPRTLSMGNVEILP